MTGGGAVYGHGALILRVGARQLPSAADGATWFSCHTTANLSATRRIWVIVAATIIIEHPPINFVLTGSRTVRSDVHYKKTTILFDTVLTAILRINERRH